MEAHQQRVVDEKIELDKKREGLMTFIKSERFTTLPLEEQRRMRKQSVHMGMYSDVLGERIAAFKQ